MTVTLFIPCFVDTCFPQVGTSVVEILERLGHRVQFAGQLVCCGQPAMNAGFWDEARTVAGPVIDDLSRADVVVVPSGSCTATIRNFYPELFAGTPRQTAALLNCSDAKTEPPTSPTRIAVKIATATCSPTSIVVTSTG